MAVMVALPAIEEDMEMVAPAPRTGRVLLLTTGAVVGKLTDGTVTVTEPVADEVVKVVVGAAQRCVTIGCERSGARRGARSRGPL